MVPRKTGGRLCVVGMLVALMLAACMQATIPTHYATTVPADPLPAEIPALPFSDNPDPTLCGIPQPYGDDRPGLVVGKVEGEVVSPIVYLYESHLRMKITGQVYPNTRVRILLRQTNPELNYFYVESTDLEPKQRGWVPAPFLIEPDDL